MWKQKIGISLGNNYTAPTSEVIRLVGKIGFDENEWYFQPEQPLNITFEYIMDNPSVFTAKTKIKMFISIF